MNNNHLFSFSLFIFISQSSLIDGYKLLITFDNNEQKVLNLSKYIKEGTVYNLLRDKNLFNRCYIDSENSICWDKDSKLDSSIIWSNKIDIGSDTCYLESE